MFHVILEDICVYGVGVGVAHAVLVRKKLSFILNEITLQLG